MLRALAIIAVLYVCWSGQAPACDPRAKHVALSQPAHSQHCQRRRPTPSAASDILRQAHPRLLVHQLECHLDRRAGPLLLLGDQCRLRSLLARLVPTLDLAHLATLDICAVSDDDLHLLRTDADVGARQSILVSVVLVPCSLKCLQHTDRPGATRWLGAASQVATATRQHRHRCGQSSPTKCLGNDADEAPAGSIFCSCLRRPATAGSRLLHGSGRHVDVSVCMCVERCAGEVRKLMLGNRRLHRSR